MHSYGRQKTKVTLKTSFFFVRFGWFSGLLFRISYATWIWRSLHLVKTPIENIIQDEYDASSCEIVCGKPKQTRAQERLNTKWCEHHKYNKGHWHGVEHTQKLGMCK